ncbi:hypothetical protein SZ25_00897 [Candidatus Arcanobacter lacustris]|uniref:Uncharacterized protein n=1 Tax=Candidatus Arcanibacter lacustris TaxID=1607817 RepID=A0A0F5MMH9_9RICK|nr:hypothetical protein SZ25_00897 [Candidatus Arcanobacter lacustris]
MMQNIIDFVVSIFGDVVNRGNFNELWKTAK